LLPDNEMPRYLDRRTSNEGMRPMKQTLKIILASALATVALIKGVPALAEPVVAPVNVSIVRTADLDLASKTGQRTLEKRLAIAAHAVCDTASAADLKARNSERDCRANVLASGRSKARAIVARNGGDLVLVAAQ
jgi:UrcA family protein